MASFEFQSGRQFETDPISGQIFYREPIDGSYSPWTPLASSDYHLSQPSVHNVKSPSVYLLCTDLQFSPQLFNAQAVYPAFHSQGAPPAPSHIPPCSTEQAPTQTQARRALRTTHRSARAHNPVRGQRDKPREGGRGRTRGAANYRPRELEVLLDHIEGELPIGAKGWNAVGTRFREWAVITQHPARTDRSLELKYKQVSSSCLLHMTCH